MRSNTSDSDFLKEVESSLKRGFESFKPDFVIYNAGTDCMIGDPLGGLSLSEACIKKRDEIVFKYCYEIEKVPTVMILSGGFLKSIAPLVADSIRNLIQRFKLLEENQSNKP